MLLLLPLRVGVIVAIVSNYALVVLKSESFCYCCRCYSVLLLLPLRVCVVTVAVVNMCC